MARPHRLILAAVLALGTYGPALAQQGPARKAGTPAYQPPPHARQATQPGDQPSAAREDSETEQQQSYPIFAVTSIEALRTTHAPVTDVVVVNGVTSAEGWTGGELVPLRRGGPSDGVLDLVFVADAPTDSAVPAHYVPIQAIIPLEAGHPFKGVRVRSATNALVIHDFPGYAAAKPPADPCGPCIGKVLVPRNGTPPAGVPASDIVRAADLPPDTRVIHPDDGVSDVTPNPNRLTIIVGVDGHIVDAAWE
ncbi:MAG TPA: hypothetical protein VHB27_17215 [Rhodopila sp.]|uniref:hypothetical protein n=1 Tax=Rhodopila sp. TaxID=2480087 RepID=UPI002BD0071D|nr:hypothetical protein [Rhodopila sp.]HVY16965.1 hypothetical protein [Rhodopila sp.]